MSPTNGRTTFAELAAQWLASNPSKRPDTRATDEYHLRAHFLPALGPRRISDIKPAHLQDIVNQLAARLSPRTVRRGYGVARAIFAFAMTNDMIVRTPCRGVKLPRVVQPSFRTPSPEELAALATATEPQYRLMVYLGALLGLRFSEVAGLRLSRIDFDARSIHVEETVTRDGHGRPVVGPPKSNASRRVIAMPAALVDLLQAHIDEFVPKRGEEDPLVFTAPDGGRGFPSEC